MKSLIGMDDESLQTLLICPLTGRSLEEMLAQARQALQAGADALECRLDYLDRLPEIQELRDWFQQVLPAKVIATCRPERQGGRFCGPERKRLVLLTRAVQAGAHWIDVESDVPPGDRPPGRVILSFHDFQRRPDDLSDLVQELDRSRASANKVAFAADSPEDALRCFDQIRQASKPTLALAMGEHGVLSRLAARKFGAFGTFASLDDSQASAPGQPTLEQIRTLYRWDCITPDTPLYGVIGCPVAHSMSPAIHNASFAALGLPGLYVPLRVEACWDHFARLIDGIEQRPWLDWRGLSVTLPHKQHALRYVGVRCCDELTRKIGAVNTLTFQPGQPLQGHNTDYAAALDSLCEALGISREKIADHPCAILGAGGVARALVAALRHYGAGVTIFNRTVSRAEALAEEFDAQAAPLTQAPHCQADTLINCTSVGMHPNTSASPIDRIPPSVQLVFDTIYNPVRTRLLEQAAEAGCRTLTGLDMFVEQGAAQFELWTGQKAPRQVMRDVILEKLVAASAD